MTLTLSALTQGLCFNDAPSTLKGISNEGVQLINANTVVSVTVIPRQSHLATAN